jgi:hypothetical protein
MKHALYEITRGIPAPIVSHKSKTNGIAHLVRSMKKGDSALVLAKQAQSAKQAARNAGVMLVWQRVGKGTTVRIWHMGAAKPEAKLLTAISQSRGLDATKPAITKQRPYTKRSDYWKSADHRSRMAKARVAKANARKFKTRAARKTAKAPRAAGTQLFLKTGADQQALE